jgi:hypothetical protein
MADKNKMQKVLEEAAKFVAKRKGEWDHAAWEEFLESAAELGFGKDFETCRNLGNVLEGAKYLYFHAPKAKSKEKAAAKPRLATKAKPKAKLKPKSKAE